jgi:hypothetical protein
MQQRMQQLHYPSIDRHRPVTCANDRYRQQCISMVRRWLVEEADERQAVNDT